MRINSTELDWRWFIPSVVLYGVIMAAIMQSCSLAEAAKQGLEGQEVPLKTILRCGLGEARGEGFEGLTAVFEAIRNRGTLKGVYGCNAKFTENPGIWQMALESWKKSAHTNLVKSADHWHSIHEPPAWWEKYGTFTVQIGAHKFYKEVYR